MPSEPPNLNHIIQTLNLAPHKEGGYYRETDRHPSQIPAESVSSNPSKPKLKSLSSTIYYLLTPNSPLGTIHLNQSRTIHTLIHGRGRYALIHPDTGDVETFVVGRDIAHGERIQWVVEGGVYKGSYLERSSTDGEDGDNTGEEGLLISETVIPGFEMDEHEFLTLEKLQTLVSEESASDLAWMVRK